MKLKLSETYQTEKEMICELCKKFYVLGWVSGTGGGMSIKVEDNLALIAPSGVQKEEIKPSDLFLIDFFLSTEHSASYSIVENPPEHKISACTSIFVNIYKQRASAGAVIHSHSLNAVMLTKVVKDKEVTLKGYEMLKGLEGSTYFGSHTLPILDNVEHECDLADAVGEIVAKYPSAHAVLVRDHGIYVWGKTPQQAKVHAECYDYLFSAYVKELHLKALNLI
ncbi:MAG: methylthioribulose 1-phosphate dehydratase [Candidatus Caenarcaniphilales bacterium]|nr:methylthioribulose 1-phosphate dehydratase [Candidatus Caenarcaniphilales bacterium]